MVDNLEKMLFLHMSWKQVGNLPNDYHSTYEELTESEKTRFIDLSNEVNNIWTLLNARTVSGAYEDKVATVLDYHQRIAPVSDIILILSKDFTMTLTKEFTKESKEAILRRFGKEFLERFLKT